MSYNSKAFAVDSNSAGIGYRSASGTSSQFPKYREWNAATDAWSSEVELATTGSAVRYTWLEYSPVSAKRVMMVLADDGQLDSYTCVGSCTTAGSWNVSLSIVDLWTSAPSGIDRPFDIEFEKTSGDAILVYDKESSVSGEELFYRVMSRGSVVFGSETAIDTPTSNAASDMVYPFIRLDSRKTSGSDEIAMIMQDDTNRDTHVMVWSGSSWGESSTLSTAYSAASSLKQEIVGIAYETNSGDIIAISANLTNVVYKAHAAGGAWDTNPTSAGTWAVGNVTYVSVKANPTSTSNEIYVAGQGDLLDLDSMYWSGSAWTDHSEHDAATNSATARDFDFAWDAGTSNGILIWMTTTNQLDFKRFNATNTYSSQFGFTATTGSQRWVALASNPTTGDNLAALGLALDGNFDITSLRWNGTNTNATRIGAADITANTGTTSHEVMSIDFQKSTASEPVTLTIALNMATGSDTPETVGNAYAVSGTGCEGTLTHDGNSASQTFLCGPNQTITFAVPTDAATSRFRFSDGTSSKQFTSCTAGACSTQTYSSNQRQFLITSLAFKATDSSTLNTQPSAFTLTDAGSNAHTAISNSWVTQGTSTFSGITWNSLDVTPTTATMSISSTGAKTFDVDIGITSDSKFQFATDQATAIDNISYDSSSNILTFNATASGSRDTVIEYSTTIFDSARTIWIDDVALTSGFTDTHSGLITITGTSFSEKTFEVLMNFLGGSSGGGNGGGSVYVPPLVGGGQSVNITVNIPDYVVPPGGSVTKNIIIRADGYTSMAISKITFDERYASWFSIGSGFPIAIVIQPGQTGLYKEIPLTVTIPESEDYRNVLVNTQIVASVSGTGGTTITTPIKVNIGNDGPLGINFGNGDTALLLIAAVIGLVIIAAYSGKKRRR